MKRELKTKYKRAYFKFNIKELKNNYIKTDKIVNLLFVVLLTTGIVASFSFSSYKSNTINNSNAKVAKLVIEASENDSSDLSINCNSNNTMTAEYSFIVTNEKDSNISDIAMSYDVVVKFSDNLLTGTTLTLTTENGTKAFDGGKKEYTFEDVGTFSAASEKSNSHTLTITGSTSVNSFFDGIMNVSVQAEQVN